MLGIFGSRTSRGPFATSLLFTIFTRPRFNWWFPRFYFHVGTGHFSPSTSRCFRGRREAFTKYMRSTVIKPVVNDQRAIIVQKRKRSKALTSWAYWKLCRLLASRLGDASNCWRLFSTFPGPALERKFRRLLCAEEWGQMWWHGWTKLIEENRRTQNCGAALVLFPVSISYAFIHIITKVHSQTTDFGINV